MFQFRRVPTYADLIQRTLIRYCRTGFPHSDIRGSLLMCSSPRLFAACHVLHRLLMPRHSPCALYSLTCFWFSFFSSFELCRHLNKSSFLKLYFVTLPFRNSTKCFKICQPYSEGRRLSVALLSFRILFVLFSFQGAG